MKRMTRPKDKYECRIAGGCPIENWMLECVEGELVRSPCVECPIMPIINKLAEYEDLEEEVENNRDEVIEDIFSTAFPNLYKLVYGGNEE